jgi:hypothetical protein
LNVGAQPKIHGSRQVNKPEFANTNWDIPGTTPAPFHIGLNKPYYILSNSDIEGSKPQAIKFKTKRLGHNPLEYHYNIPEVPIKPVTPPKFIRDQMKIDDIEGAKPKKDKYKDFKTRETMKTLDIIGYWPES